MYTREMEIPWNKIKKTKTCWNWTGYTYNGYGKSYIKGKTKGAHKLVYEILVGEIPQGLELDHLCRNRRCVNPKHLEPVTHTENRRRSLPFLKRKTHCKKGHPFDRVLIRKDGAQNKICTICKRISQIKYRKNPVYIERKKLHAQRSYEKLHGKPLTPLH